jgi:hypothetical protein
VSRWDSSRVIKDDLVDPVLLESVSGAPQPFQYVYEGPS